MRRSSLLLAGGLGTRLAGMEKALMTYRDTTLLERTLKVLDSVSGEVIISLRDKLQLRNFSEFLAGRIVVTDRIKDAGPLAGMLSGFERASGEYVFTAACDMPFLNVRLIDMMFDMVEDHDALIPVTEHGVKEPLHAVYRRDVMLESIEYAMEHGHRSILSPVASLKNVLYLDANVIREIDKDLKSFVNINTPSDMRQLENLYP